MNRRLICALLAACLLLTCLPAPASAESERFRTMEELTSYLFYDCTSMLADEIEFAYTSALDYYFEDGFPWKMLYSSGLLDMDVSIDRKYRKVEIRNIVYYPGFKAAQAKALEQLYLLDEDERTLLARAEAIVENACLYAQSPYQVLVNLHDALVERVIYTSGNDDVRGGVLEDTATGALIYGKAECDGYADAMYLLCTLAGFPVRMVSGHADNGDGSGAGPHMWNLVWWEDGWYHMDVTWDDLDWRQAPSMTKYTYLLAGSATISSHIWTEEYLVSQPQTYTNWDYYYYTADNTGITYGAYYSSLDDAVNYAVYMQRNFDQKMINIMVNGDYDGKTDEINELLQKKGMKGQWWSWAKKLGDYSYISIYVE